MPNEVLSTLLNLCNQFPLLPYESNIITLLILWIKELRSEVTKWLSQCYGLTMKCPARLICWEVVETLGSGFS
jgi:hypothetical protein